MRFDCEVAVIGGGPGGLTAALYLQRFKRSTLLFLHGKPRAAWIPRTHNLMGFPRGISGRELLNRLGRQVTRLGTERIIGQAKVHREKDAFQIESEGEFYRCRKVILATGFEDRQPPISGIEELRDEGLLRYCPVCDAYDFRGREIAVIAQDDSGVQRALFLARFAGLLKIVIPDDLRLAPQRVREIRAARAKVFRGHVLGIQKSRSPRGVWIELPRFAVFAQVAYIELGCEIRDSAFHHVKGLIRSPDGFLHTTTEQRTSIPGLFAVGDCVNLLGQISVAAGQAAVAATTIHNDLWG